MIAFDHKAFAVALMLRWVDRLDSFATQLKFYFISLKLFRLSVGVG